MRTVPKFFRPTLSHKKIFTFKKNLLDSLQYAIGIQFDFDKDVNVNPYQFFNAFDMSTLYLTALVTYLCALGLGFLSKKDTGSLIILNMLLRILCIILISVLLLIRFIFLLIVFPFLLVTAGAITLKNKYDCKALAPFLTFKINKDDIIVDLHDLLNKELNLNEENMITISTFLSILCQKLYVYQDNPKGYRYLELSDMVFESESLRSSEIRIRIILPLENVFFKMTENDKSAFSLYDGQRKACTFIIPSDSLALKTLINRLCKEYESDRQPLIPVAVNSF